MLEQMPPDEAHYLRRAFESRCRAASATQSAVQRFWTDMEARWLLLADSCDQVRRADAFLAAARSRNERIPPADTLDSPVQGP